jgi:hypothetical protein
MARTVGPNARAIAEGIRNDNASNAYAAGVGDDYIATPCLVCKSTDRTVQNVYGSSMGVRCRCGQYEIVERPRRVRSQAM